MTRKDYIILAEALRVQHRSAVDRVIAVSDGVPSNASPHSKGILDGVNNVIGAVCDVLARDNSRFNRAHFLAVVRGDKSLTSRLSRNGVRS